MASALSIWPTGGGGYTDYTTWLADASRISRNHKINQPRTLNFRLADGVAGFSAPEAGNRVKLVTDSFGEMFRGYLVRTPAKTPLGLSGGSGIYAYDCTCIDESLALEWQVSKKFPTLPPFANKTQGQILAELISILGGSMGTSNVDSGILIPYFRVRPEEGFWDAVRRLSDRTNMALWFTAGQAYYKQFNAQAFEYIASESSSYFNPSNLDVQPAENPVYNDVVGIGGIEPQGYIREYLIGDGFTDTWALKFPVYGAESSKLFENEFTGTSIDSSVLTETDPDGVISMSSGSLRLVAAAAAHNNRLTLKQGVEIGGTLKLRAGRIRSNSGASSALVGALMKSDTGLTADCVAGFSMTADSFQPLINGSLVGPSYAAVPGKTYQLLVTVNSTQEFRRRRQFFSLRNSYGGDTLTAGATVSFSVIELSDDSTDDPTEVLNYAASIANIDAFLWYTVIAVAAGASADISLNFTLIQKGVGAQLFSKKASDSSYVQRPIGDKSDPFAWATITEGSEGHQLQFFGDKTLEAKELGYISYRAAGLARARVQSSSSITAEAAKSGDTGVRTATLPEISPAPRNAHELQRAIQAFIDDHSSPMYQGSWKFNSVDVSLDSLAFQANTFQNDSFQQAASTFVDPVPGKFITVDSTSRYPKFTALVQETQLDYVVADPTLGLESIQVTVKFGQLSRLDQIQPLEPAEDALTGPNDQVKDIDPVEFTSVGEEFSRDIGFIGITTNISPSTIEVDAGTGADAAFEIRKTDAGWGTSETLNRISESTAQLFNVSTGSSEMVVFVKNRDSLGRVSRYPSIIRIVYPLTLAGFSPEAVGENLVDDYGFEFDPTAYDGITRDFVDGFSLPLYGNYISKRWFFRSFDNFSGNVPDNAWQARRDNTAGKPRTGSWCAQLNLKSQGNLPDAQALLCFLQYPSAGGNYGVDTAGTPPFMNPSRLIPIRGGDTYLAGGYSRYDGNIALPSNVSIIATIGAVFYKADGSLAVGSVPWTGGTSGRTSPTRNAGYFYQDTVYTAPSDAAYVAFVLNAEILNLSGSTVSLAPYQVDVRFDDLFFKKATRGTHARYRPTTNPLTAQNDDGTGTHDKITIAAFVNDVANSPVSYSGTNIPLLARGTKYWVCVDDPDLTGGALTFLALTSLAAALLGEFRYFIGSITTPAAAAGDTAGDNNGGFLS